MNKIILDKTKDFVRQNYAEIVEQKLKIAEDVMNHTFLFDMPHDLERTTESVHFDGELKWDYVLNGDKEFAYQMARHRYFVDLAEAYQLTGNEDYVACIIDIMTDFIRRVPFEKNHLAWRTLETGLRAEYWTRAMALIKDSALITDDFVKMYKDSLDVHAKVLIDYKIPHHRLSNWGVLQDHGLYAIALELGNDDYKNIALERLYDEANLQVMADGLHWEVSTTYHNEVLQCFIDTMLRAREVGNTLDEKFTSKVKDMAYVNAYFIKPNHNGPLYGDSDVTDLRGNLSACALLLNDGMLKSIAGNVFDYDNAWRVGDDGLKEYSSIENVEPDFRSVAMDDSGNYIMRSSFGEDANYLIFHNSNTGGGHAHEDKLSFELSIKGQDLLVDTGRYSYVWRGERKTLKSYMAHNTTAVDNSHFITPNGWSYIGTIAPSIREKMIVTDKYELVRGTHIGYVGKLRGSITTSRAILWIKPDIYIVIDEFFGKGTHMYASFWNFAPHTTIDIKDNVITANAGGIKSDIHIFAPKIKLEKEQGLYSHHYNAIENIERVQASFKGKANAHMMSVIVGDTARHKDVNVELVQVKDEYGNVMRDADAIKIDIDGTTYTFIATFREHIKLLLAGDKPATGKYTLYIGDEYNIIKW